jgi:lysophospholipase L1-like esterase
MHLHSSSASRPSRHSLRARPRRLAGLPIFFLPLLPWGQPPEEPAGLDQAPEVAELRERLRNGPGPVRIIVFGDSLTAGWGADDPETEGFPAVFARALQARYPGCAVEVIAAGGPGDTSDVGIIRVEREVVSRRPDVVVLQFGGNDQGFGRKPQDLTDDLTTLIRTVTGPRLGALCIAAAPPMNDVDANTPFVRAAIFAAESENVPVANFDRALREADRDFRGPFCWWGHPGSYSHLIMGLELLRAWDRLMGQESPLAVEIEGYSELLPADALPRLHIATRNSSDQMLDTELEYGPGLLTGWERFQLEPGQQGDVTQRITLPEFAPSSRTQTSKLSAVARSAPAEASDLDCKWLSVAPVVAPDPVEGTLDPDKLTWHALSASSLVLGRNLWEGDEDLSARFALAWYQGRLMVIVEVTDQDLSIAPEGEHVSHGDSVEVCLDLRGSADQGKPVYSRDVVLLIVRPAVTDDGAPDWSPLDGLTGRLIGVSASGELPPNGYTITLAIPERALARPDEETIDGIGFDVHVNDSDFGHGRDCQMVWAGTAQNYLNPARLGALVASADNPARWRVSLR